MDMGDDTWDYSGIDHNDQAVILPSDHDTLQTTTGGSTPSKSHFYYSFLYLIPVAAPEQGTRIQFKRLDKIYDPSSNTWNVSDTTQIPVKKRKGRYDPYADYAFIVRRKVLPPTHPFQPPKYVFKVFIWSRWLRSALKEATKDSSIWWDTQPLKLDPQTLLAYLPRIKEHLTVICPGISLDIESEETQISAQHLQLLINYLETDYDSTLTKIKNLLDHQEMTWDLLWAIFLPGTTVISTCAVTSEKRAYRLRSIRAGTSARTRCPCWKLKCEYIEANSSDSGDRTFGWAESTLEIEEFSGREKINQLWAYPVQWDPQPENLQEDLTSRGLKWARIPAIHHMHTSGRAADVWNEKRFYVQGRIMIDQDSFTSNNNQNVPYLQATVELALENHPAHSEVEGSNILIYASPILYGFDLTNKHWHQFNVQDVSEIKWNDDIFKNLAIEPDTKTVLQSLVEVHAEDRAFDDFVEGKGLGLVINLFGPPGVGKSLTVEAISEHLRRPLYVLGAGDLGTDAGTVERRLKDVLSLIPIWNAILLIDEADVFLEKRGTHDLERNAIVAVFLREIEYFRGILFLTTNRVREFDHAFQSRIHISLHYTDLDWKTRALLWKAFLDKSRSNPFGVEEISPDNMDLLAKQDLNGRQIKNVVKVASSLAKFEKAPLGYGQLVRTMNLAGHNLPDPVHSKEIS